MSGGDLPSSTVPSLVAPGDLGDPDRLAAIARLGLHGHVGDLNLEATVATVAAACDVPLVVVTIVTTDLQTHPAELGLGASTTEVRDGLSFCAEVVQTGRRLVVPDAAADPVYAANPLVVAGAIGAYAGEPNAAGSRTSTGVRWHVPVARVIAPQLPRGRAARDQVLQPAVGRG